jgi:hypothetical protein
MRKRQSFLLTVISSETGDSSLCGRLKVISSGKTSSFCCLDELAELINMEMDEREMSKAQNPALPVPSPQEKLPAA